MVSYTFIDRVGNFRRVEVPTLEQALYKISVLHEQGLYIDKMTTWKKVYNRDEILRLCQKNGLFR